MTEPSVVVADSGPLIALALINELHLLEKLFGKVVVPNAVWRECVVDNPTAPAAPQIAAATFLEVEHVDAAGVAAFDVAYGLGAGETEAIVYARTLAHPLLLIDERHARRVAETLALRRTGTVGVLLRARRAGLIDLLRPRLQLLVDTGNFISKSVIIEALKQVGESLAPTT